MLCKLVGVIFTVAAGLPAGKEGPMVRMYVRMDGWGDGWMDVFGCVRVVCMYAGKEGAMVETYHVRGCTSILIIYIYTYIHTMPY